MTEASEAIFQDQVLQIATMNGWLWFHATPKQLKNGIWRTDGKGFPDLVLAHYDRGVIFAELKTSDGRITPAQKIWAVALGRHVEYYVWRPADLQKIATRLGPKPRATHHPR